MQRYVLGKPTPKGYRASVGFHLTGASKRTQTSFWLGHHLDAAGSKLVQISRLYDSVPIAPDKVWPTQLLAQAKAIAGAKVEKAPEPIVKPKTEYRAVDVLPAPPAKAVEIIDSDSLTLYQAIEQFGQHLKQRELSREISTEHYLSVTNRLKCTTEPTYFTGRDGKPVYVKDMRVKSIRMSELEAIRHLWMQRPTSSKTGEPIPLLASWQYGADMDSQSLSEAQANRLLQVTKRYQSYLARLNGRMHQKHFPRNDVLFIACEKAEEGANELVKVVKQLVEVKSGPPY